MKKKLLTVLVFVKINTRRFFRDRLALFFTVVFPLIFLFVFGGIFGRNSDASFKIALISESKNPFASQYIQRIEKAPGLKVDRAVDSLDVAKEKMKRGEVDATIVLPPSFGAVKNGKYPTGQADVTYTQNNEQAARTLVALLQAQFDVINAELTHSEKPFTVTSEQSNEKGLRRFDYTFSGLLGFSIIGLGIFGPVNVFPELKKQGILRRLHTTPLRVWQYFVSNAVSQAIIGLLTMSVLFVVAMIVFDLKFVGNIFELALFLAFSIITILGIGLAIGGWARNERQAAPLANIVVFPMMFLSGTFFPRFAMPQILQRISDYLPLTPVIDGIRLILTEGKSLIDIAPQIGLISAWMVVIYIIAFRVFRWE